MRGRVCRRVGRMVAMMAGVFRVCLFECSESLNEIK